jgi:hypothetical protein
MAAVAPQIRKSEKNLLERLFTVIHHLTPTQMEQLLREEEDIVAKRKEARSALEDCKTAVFVVGGRVGNTHMQPCCVLLGEQHALLTVWAAANQ